VFDVAAYTKFCDSIAPEVAAMKLRQRAAMDVMLQAETESLARLEAAKGERGRWLQLRTLLCTVVCTAWMSIWWPSCAALGVVGAL
jgi:hypothetical protein